MSLKINWAEESVTPYRSKNMRAIKSKNTRPENLLRKALWNAGVRYRIYGKQLPGSPDIYIKKYKLAIFIDGEFWHGYDWVHNKERIHTRRAFWIAKIERNMQRDHEVNEELQQLGYTVLRFWGNDVQKNVGAAVFSVLNHMDSFDCNYQIG